MTVQLDQALVALRREFAAEIASGLIVHLGIYNCRTKNNDPDGPWSEHAWPNAVDVMLKRIKGTRTPTPAAKAVGYRVAAWMRAHPELWSEVFWQIAAHYDHVHGTATPRRNYDNEQIPPCAGGPDDPEPDPGDEEEMTPEERRWIEDQFKAVNANIAKVDTDVWAHGRVETGGVEVVPSMKQYVIRTKAGVDTLLRKDLATDDDVQEAANQIIAAVPAATAKLLGEKLVAGVS